MRDQINRKRWQRSEAVCGVCCFIAGILAPVLGIFLLTLEWLAGVTVHPGLHAIGTTLLIVGIPLIVFAGFCLDWAEAKPKERQRKLKEHAEQQTRTSKPSPLTHNP